MASQGYIKIYRQIKDDWVYDDKPFCKMAAWIDLLLRANYKDAKIVIDNNLVNISRGTFHTSIVKLADCWGWDKRKVSNYLNLLEKDGKITKKCTTHGTTITIVKYGVFQDSGTTDCTTECTTDVLRLHTNNKEKRNIKNSNNIMRFSSENQEYDFDALEKAGKK